MRILGLSCGHRAAAACLVEDGKLLSARSEVGGGETSLVGFPKRALQSCFADAGGARAQIDAVAVYTGVRRAPSRVAKPWMGSIHGKERSLPREIVSRRLAEPRLRHELGALGVGEVRAFHYPEHHRARAARAFFPSRFAEAGILVLDALEENSVTIGAGRGSTLELNEQLIFPYGLGAVTSALTDFVGLAANAPELSRLALEGHGTYTDRLLDGGIDLREDGSLGLDPEAAYPRFVELLDGPPRGAGTPLTQRDKNIVRSLREMVEEVALCMAWHVRRRYDVSRLCLCGRGPLTEWAQGALRSSGMFDEVWVPPEPGEAGGAWGAALAVCHSTS